MKSPSLVWSPTNQYLRQRIKKERRLRLLIAPFVTLEALKRLVDICDDTTDLQVVVRWQPKDLLSGASDLAIYPYLKTLQIPLYTHPAIHLKLFVFTDALAFHTSGNITRKGLGLDAAQNVEIGCEVHLAHADWVRLLQILNQSNRVDDDIYQTALNYTKANKLTSPPLPPLNLAPNIDKRFSRLSLPSTSSPEALYALYAAPSIDHASADEASALVHDLVLYDIPSGLAKDEFFAVLKDRFTKHAFVIEIVKLIKAAGSARFGLVNEWITTNCSDKPTPYRWEMKPATRCLYDWLSHFFPKISWHVPGARSMVIQWKA